MENIYTNQETYILPSKGKIYDKPVKETFSLRSMTTAQEMRRCSPSVNNQYKLMCDIIDECLIDKLGISVYDLHLGDYQYLLHKLRIVTYGSDYKVAVRCPYCGHIYQTSINLDDLNVIEYSDDCNKLLTVELPTSKRTIELRYQTPRLLDKIEQRKREILQKSEDKNINYSLLLTLMYSIKTVDGEEMNHNALESFVKNLPMRDTNILLQRIDKINKMIGIEPSTTIICEKCGNEIDFPFRYSSEFFGPTID